MDKKKVILTSLASAAVLGASVLVSQPSVVKADEGKAEEQAVAPAQPQAAAEGDSGAQTEKGSENAGPANPGATNPAKMTKEELMKALGELEEQAISDIKDKEAIEDKEDAAEAVKEYIGKMYISDTLESGELSLDNIIAELPEGAEDKAVVTGPEVQTNKKLSTEEKALLDQAEKDAKEQVSQATDALVQALESLENAVIEDIKKDASITDKEAAIKEAKEEIGKEDLLKAIADEDLEIGDVIVDWPADTSEHKTVAEPVSEFTDEDQAKLDEADKEAQVDAAKVRSDLIATLEKIEKSTIDDINKDATITDKEAAIKAAKEVIGKDGILKAIEEGDIDASDLLDDFLAEDSDQVTPAEAMSQEDFSSQDQAKLAAADKEAAEEAAKVRSDLIATLEKIEKSTIDDITKDATITDKEAAIKAAKEVIGKDGILKAIEDGDIEASDLLDDFLAEDSDQVTPAEAMSQEDFSSQDQAKLAAADKEAAEEVAKVRSDLIATLEKIEKSTIDDINKDATITDKEAAIMAAKEVIGKDAILKAIEEGDIEASDLLDDFLAEDSDQVTPAEEMNQEDFSSQDQAKLAAADKEAAEENSNAKKLELSKLEEQVAKIKVQLSSLQVSGDKNSQVKDLQQTLADYEDAIKTLSSVMSAVLEIEDFKGGANAVEAATAELPEYNKGANAVEAAVNELPAYGESGAPAVANVPAYGESGSPAVANVPVYGESGAPAVASVPAYAESGAPAVVNVPAYGESGTPIVNNALPYGESGAPAVANVPVYGESGSPAVANIPAYAEKIEPAVNEVPEYTGSVAPLATSPTLGTEQDRTYKAPAATDEQFLPNTGSQDASAVASLGFIGLLLGLLPFAKRKFNK
ncbi:Sialidase A precursor [Streptococcus oralis]|uniref:Sialidase A n=1 Tax=Streptococcus oralis TaxID=1303 RepID=A0A3R9IVH2_STROR|nr:SIALI-17 repeat-containing surface protein [Streptococcus oralis]RSI73280.1 Sialidase A precursor [Streptococcus oralis]